MVSRPDDVIAVIPAKAHSRRLPGKNLRPFAGRPLVAHTIAQAVASREVAKVCVSTDSEEIAALARELGADVPFLRSAALAGPEVHSTQPVIDLLERSGDARAFGLVMVLLPTCPLRRVEDIDAIARLARRERRNVLSVVDLGKTLFQLRTIDGTAQLSQVSADTRVNLQHGDSPPVLALNGSCYCGPMTEFMRDRTFHQGQPLGYVMDEVTGMDIDTLEQFEAAEALYLRRQAAASATIEQAELDAIVFDFDGVLTDNRVLTFADGTEAVAANRSDGLAFEYFRRAGLPCFILSKERNKVVQARGDKIKVPVIQGIEDKAGELRRLCAGRGFALSRVMYVGNDLNDLPAMAIVGYPVAVADAFPEVRAAARLVLPANGGAGAARALLSVIRSPHWPA